MAGAAAAGVVALGIIAFGERAGWWHIAIPWEPYFLALVEIDFTLCAFVFLITWRIARRFGGRGLVVAGFIGTYVLLGIVGHGLMRLVAGPAAADQLARRPWEMG